MKRPDAGRTPVQTVRADFPHTAYQVVAQVEALCRVQGHGLAATPVDVAGGAL